MVEQTIFFFIYCKKFFITLQGTYHSYEWSQFNTDFYMASTSYFHGGVLRIHCEGLSLRKKLLCRLVVWHKTKFSSESTQIERSYNAFLFFSSLSFAVSYRYVCKRSWTLKELKFCTNRSSSLPQKTLLLKCLKCPASSPIFNCMTLWHHTASTCQIFSTAALLLWLRCFRTEQNEKSHVFCKNLKNEHNMSWFNHMNWKVTH